MNSEPFNSLGIDVGGSKIAAGVVKFPEGIIANKRIIPTLPARGGEAVLSDIVRVSNELAGKASGAGLALGGLGLGVCELVDPAGKIFSSNLVHLRDQPLIDQLKTLRPIVVEADVRAAALAEAMFGAGRSRRSFLYITVGTGISSCLVIDGKPFVGAHGATGTIASSRVELDCENCGTKSHGSLEEKAAGPALVARFNRRYPGTAKRGEDVFVAVEAGNLDAIEIVDSAADALGAAVGFQINALDPEIVIVGGGLGLRTGRFWEKLIASARRHIWSDVNRGIPIVHAETGQDAGLLGAAATVWIRTKERLE